MSSFNSVTLLGNMTRDPALKYLPNQTAVTDWGMAMNRKYKVGDEERDDVCFVDCAAFGKLAETIQQHFAKGKPILVQGRLKYDQWEDKNGGGKRNKLSVIVERFCFVGAKQDGEQQPPASKPYPRDRQTAREPAQSGAQFDEADKEFDDSIPFAAPLA